MYSTTCCRGHGSPYPMYCILCICVCVDRVAIAQAPTLHTTLWCSSIGMCLWWYTIPYIIQYNIPLVASACYICIECRVYVYTILGIQYAITRYSVSMSISYTPWDMTSHDTIPYRCGGIQIWVQIMDSGYMSEIAYFMVMTTYGYHIWGPYTP